MGKEEGGGGFGITVGLTEQRITHYHDPESGPDPDPTLALTLALTPYRVTSGLGGTVG